MPDPFPTSGIPFYKDKRVCVTGATGLIGSYAVKLLKESGAHVRAVTHARTWDHDHPVARETVFPADLQVPVMARAAVQGCEIVVNCAGITGGIGIVTHDPTSYVGPATAMAINVIEACRAERVERMGFLSSTTVYAPSDEPVVEGNEGAEPYELYWGIGWSKRFLEKLCRYYVERAAMKIAVVRPSGAYGRFDNFDESTSHVIPGMINRALRSSDTFEVWGDGGDTRDFIHSQDVAFGFLQAVAWATDADPINLASGHGINTGNLARLVLNCTGSTAEFRFNSAKPTALRTRLVSIEKARRLLDFAPTISLADGIRDTIAWRRA